MDGIIGRLFNIRLLTKLVKTQGCVQM